MFNPTPLVACALIFLCAHAHTITLEWDPNPEPLVKGYRVYYGTLSRVYTAVTDAGPRNSTSILGLIPGKRYYFAVTAYNTDGLESDFSEEVTTVIEANIPLPFWYDFRVKGVLSESLTPSQSSSAYWWLQSGGRLTLSNEVGSSSSSVTPADPFQLLLRRRLSYSSSEIYIWRKDDAQSTSLKAGWNGISLFARYTNEANYYFASIRMDGNATIRKRVHGVYHTLLQKKVFPGIYSLAGPGLLPTNSWIGIKLILGSERSGTVTLSLWTDVGKTGTWTQVGQVEDDGARYGPLVETPGLCGIRSDLDIFMDDFRVSEVAPAEIAEAEVLPYPNMLVEDEVTDSIPISFRLASRDGSGITSIVIRGPVAGSFELLRSRDCSVWESLLVERLGDTEFVFRDETAPPDKAFYYVRRLDY